MKIKYLQERKRKNGTTAYLIQVPDYVKFDVPQYESRTFDTLQEARAYSLDIEAAFLRSKSKKKRQSPIIKGGTVASLVRYYRGSEEFYNLSENSKKSYIIHIQRALDLVLPGYNMKFGDLEISRVNRDHVRDIINICRENVSQHRALHTIKVLRVVWSVGVRGNKVLNNPFRDPKIKSIPPRTVLWTEEQINLFVQTADDMGLYSLGSLVLLCYQLCQRPGDIRQLKWDNIKGNIASFTQEKTGTDVDVPIFPAYLERIKEHRHSDADIILICETNNLPYDRYWYAKLARKVRQKAKLPKDLRIQDLRRTGATRLASSSATEDEIMSVTGHKSREIVSTYVKHSQDMAKNAMLKAWS